MSERREPEGIDPSVARRIRLVLLDVDGVLTDNGVFLGGSWLPAGVDEPDPRVGHQEWKRFDIQDGLGVKLLLASGIAVELLSGRPSFATEMRARELGVRATQVADGYKLEAAERLLAEQGADWGETAVVGDDLADLPLMRRAGLAATVPNAVREIEDVAGWTARAAGGHGAVREFAHALLEARGERESAVARYEAARTRDPARVADAEVSRVG